MRRGDAADNGVMSHESECVHRLIILIKRLAIAVVLAIPLAQPAMGGTGTILFVVVNSGSLTAQETAKKTLMTGWGYTVTPISASASQATFDSSVLTSSMAYIGSEVTAATLGTKLVSTTIPVVNEVDAQCVQLGFSSSASSWNSNSLTITNTTHYITSTVASGSLTIFSSNQPLHYFSGTLGGFTSLGEKAAGKSMLAVFERGDTIYPSGTAKGRRVYLPWGGSGLDINTLNASGQTLMQRSIEWCLMPIGWWKLNDASGTSAVDSSGNSHTGTLSGPTWTTGKIAGGLKFDGTNDYASIPNDTDFQVTDALTVAGWVKGNRSWDMGSYSDVILRKGDANPNNWELGIMNGHVSLNLDNYDGSGFEGTTTLSLNAWHHVAATWDGSTVRLYLDGVLNNTPAAYTASLGTDTRPVYLGGRIGSTDVTSGTIDDVRFYNRCLTAAEIAALAKANPVITSWQQVAPP
jgi:hypothetical protein